MSPPAGGRSIHDNRVTSYEVDAERCRIVLRTLSEDRSERTDVVFNGVLAYHLEGDNFGNILLDIGEIALDRLVTANRALFEEGVRFAWPGSWNESPESCLRHFEAEGGRAFEISSAYGLGGWVIAAEYRLEPGVARAL